MKALWKLNMSMSQSLRAAIARIGLNGSEFSDRGPHVMVIDAVNLNETLGNKLGRAALSNGEVLD
jgi:hypothetical protein